MEKKALEISYQFIRGKEFGADMLDKIIMAVIYRDILKLYKKKFNSEQHITRRYKDAHKAKIHFKMYTEDKQKEFRPQQNSSKPNM